MSYQIQPLEPQQFEHLFSLTQAELQQQGIVQVTVNKASGFPCRLSLKDAEEGDIVLLLNYNHLPGPGPYQSSHAIFISKNGLTASQLPGPGTVPPMIARKILSLRAFDGDQMMLDGRVCQGTEADVIIRELLALPGCAYVHIHSATRGCYLAAAHRS
ncbi:DUF1203 domain-containing protein [Lacimicrobium alkaliphilum]|uniref:DUF1203 domain-containing protein n=1 Tax=Lacimicrobium alkaliphilum TaxID=1526571 RepID=A0A0U2PFV8_9ALTE|nr:DUF1203 domain-containing protein [Lacimicrobium alkaliphilum]ALS98253.1 hypothetical protein AT746_08325 [Lacimicrobium alkaliphilum]